MRLVPALMAPILAAAVSLGGCALSPAQNILGSYFPAWLICAAGGVVAAMVLRQLSALAGLERHLLAPVLVYLCLALAITLALWLLLFAGWP